MKNSKFYFKKLLTTSAFLLTLLLVLWPTDSINARAAQKYGWWQNYNAQPLKNRKIEIEEKQRYSMLDLFEVPTGISKSGITFSSNKPSVASVAPATGLLTAKKPGTARITATCRGKKYVCTVKVRKKGALGSTTTYRKLLKTAKALRKFQKTPVNSKTCAKILSAAIAYHQALNEHAYVTGDGYGFLLSESDQIPVRIIMPYDYRVDDIELRIDQYIDDHLPWEEICIWDAFGKAGSSSIRVNLRRAPTKTECAMIRYRRLLYEEDGKDTVFQVRVTACDQNDNPIGGSLLCNCIIKAGSRSAVIKYTDSQGNALKLQKNWNYSLEEAHVSILNGVTLEVK